MKRMTLGVLLFGVAVAWTAWGEAAAQRTASRQATIEVFKDASCGCCAIWIEHLRKNGFTAIPTNSTTMTAIKDTRRVPPQARSCHTGVVDGYVIEGHVPAADIQRLLKERPQVLGLAVAGMPIGSPGMEGPGGKPFNVLSFDKDGRTAVYSTHQPSAN